MWNFWSGKTFWTFLEMYQTSRRFTYVIANVPYSRVDHYYSTVDDLLTVFEVLDEYTSKTNKELENFYDSRELIKDILVIVDEAHLYLWARESLTKASILNKLKLIFTQCRKRKIRIVFITQRLTQIDIYVRRLSDYVEEYDIQHRLWLELDKKNVYLNKWDVVDIETDQSVKFNNQGEAQTVKEETLIHSEYFAPLTSVLEYFALLFDKGFRDIMKEEYLTRHVCWNPDVNVKPFTTQILMKWLIITPTKAELEKIRKKKERKWKKRYEIYLPWITKIVRDNYIKVKTKILSLFKGWYEDINFQELYNECYKEDELQDKVKNLDHLIENENTVLDWITNERKPFTTRNINAISNNDEKENVVNEMERKQEKTLVLN